jgi:hypothetical protein
VADPNNYDLAAFETGDELSLDAALRAYRKTPATLPAGFVPPTTTTTTYVPHQSSYPAWILSVVAYTARSGSALGTTSKHAYLFQMGGAKESIKAAFIANNVDSAQLEIAVDKLGFATEVPRKKLPYLSMSAAYAAWANAVSQGTSAPPPGFEDGPYTSDVAQSTPGRNQTITGQWTPDPRDAAPAFALKSGDALQFFNVTGVRRLGIAGGSALCYERANGGTLPDIIPDGRYKSITFYFQTLGLADIRLGNPAAPYKVLAVSQPTQAVHRYETTPC